MTVDDLLRVLMQKAGFQVVGQPTKGATQLRIVGRLPDNKGMGQWLLVVDQLLARAEQATWKVDISKQYLRRDGKLRFGWRLIFQGESLEADMQNIAAAVVSAPRPARVEVTEVPLLGASPDRNNGAATGKGAGPSGSFPVGPLAIRRMGG
jgi:hypothetical protein